MKRRILTIVAVLALLIATAGTALADRGAPGSTFPEQPGDNVHYACTVLVANPGQDQNAAQIAQDITVGIVLDACPFLVP